MNGCATVIRCYDEVSALSPEYAFLFGRGERDSFDLSLDWFRLIIESALPVDAKPLIYVMEQTEQVRAIVPLLKRSPTWKGTEIQGLTTFYSSLYRPLLADGVTADELAVLLRQVIVDHGVDRLRLDAMDPEHASFTVIEQALRLAGLRGFRFFCFGNQYQPTAGQSFAQYFQERPSQVRNTVQRREKKFLAGGRMCILTGNTAELDLLIRDWERVYLSSWKIPEPYPKFMPGLIKLCAKRGWLRLGFAYYDEQPVAAQLWIVNHGRAAIYKLAYDEAFAALSAGTLLTVHMLRHALDQDKVSEIDYLIGDDPYKKNWMNHRRERWGIVAFNLRTVKGLVGFMAQCLGVLVHVLRDYSAQAKAWLMKTTAP